MKSCSLHGGWMHHWVPADPYFLWEVRQRGWKEEAWDRGSYWAPTCQGGCLRINCLILVIIRQYKYHSHLHRVDEKTEFLEAKKSHPNYTALNDCEGLVAHQFESEAYNLSTDPYISSWGRIAHQILAHNCLQEAAKKKKKKSPIWMVIFGLGEWKV